MVSPKNLVVVGELLWSWDGTCIWFPPFVVTVTGKAQARVDASPPPPRCGRHTRVISVPARSMLTVSEGREEEDSVRKETYRT